jgi:hypothetical protein
MGVSIRLTNFNKLFDESTTTPIIVNDLSQATKEEKARINRLISTTYVKTDLFSNEPTCDCGALSGGYSLGVICNNCKEPVKGIFDQQLKSLIWMRSPNGVAPLINPVMWKMLSKKFTKKGYNIIDWFCNTDYQPSAAKPLEIQELINLGAIRGYNNFVTNFDYYIDMLYTLKSFKSKKSEDDDLKILIKNQRDSVFSNFLPLPNKALLVIEDTNTAVYVDPIIVGAIDAIRTISSIDNSVEEYTLRQKENRTIKTIAKLSDFYYEMYKDILSSKTGLFRRHVFGTRNNFSTRAVISSNTKKHEYDELHFAWGHACTMLKIHIVNKLFKRGFTPNQCTGFIQKHTNLYHPMLDDIFKELIDESPEKGLVGTYIRNPSLARGSVQRMKITKVKTDVTDPTITMSILSVVGFNADRLI